MPVHAVLAPSHSVSAQRVALDLFRQIKYERLHTACAAAVCIISKGACVAWPGMQKQQDAANGTECAQSGSGASRTGAPHPALDYLIVGFGRGLAGSKLAA